MISAAHFAVSDLLPKQDKTGMRTPFRMTIPKNLEIRFTSNRMILEQPGSPVTSIKKPGPEVLVKLLEMMKQGIRLNQLLKDLTARGGMTAVTEFHHYFRLFDRMGWIIRTLMLDDVRPISALIPFSQEFNWREQEIGPDHTMVLSRFAHTRNINGEMVLETPLGHGKLILSDPTCALVLHALRTPWNIEGLCQAALAFPPDLMEGFLLQLLNIRAIECRQTGEQLDDNNHWEFHDLLFHSRTRTKRRDKPFGPTFPSKDRTPPAPAVKECPKESLISLHIPDLEILKPLEPQDPDPPTPDRTLTPATLGEFLYRTARIINEKEINLKNKAKVTLTQRPYPGMGSIHGLEIYPLTKDCPGLEDGLYHYHPKHHGLTSLLLSTDKIQPLLDEIDPTAELRYHRSITFVITARFHRLKPFSRSMAYSAALQDLGILLQTMNITAKAMGLSANIPYGKTAGTFANLSNIPPHTEAAIGEFILGKTAGSAS